MISIKKHFGQYDKAVQAYMKNLVISLEKQYGELDETWLVSLELIAFNYDLILKCQADIAKNGLEKYDNSHRLVKNPCISTLNNAQAYLIKLLSAFGLTVMSKSKLKNMPDTSSDDLLEDLLS